MATIPLAIQPPPQNPGPMDLYQGGLHTQQMLNALALQKQQQAQNQIAQQQSQIELEQQQQSQKDQQLFNKSFHDANGDWDQTIKNATAAGASGAFITKAQLARTEQISKMAATEKAQLDNAAAKTDQLGKDAYSLLQIQDPAERQAQYSRLRKDHILSGAYNANDLPEMVPSDQDLQSTIAHSKATQDMIKDAADLREKNAKLPGELAEAQGKRFVNLAQTMGGANNQLSWTARRDFAIARDPQAAQLIPENYTPEAAEQVRQLGTTPQQQAQIPVEKQELTDWMRKHSGKGPADFMAAKAALAPTIQFNLANQTGGGGAGGAAPSPADVAKKFGMTQEAFDQAAEKYAQTGQLPAVGRGANGIALQRAIMNRTSELHGGESLAANSSEYKALTSSLNKIQPQFEQVTAFENTAGKNLDVFLNEAKKVTDLGLPIANLPARQIANKLGGEEQAAFNAARTTALTEIAKVLSSANAGSGVLSDSARHEVEGLIGADATLGQITRAANILKQDMANRHQAYADQIADINRRLKQGSKATESTGFQLPAGAKTATGPNGHKIAVVDGKWVDAQTGNPI